MSWSDTITVLRPAWRIERGSKTADWSAPVSHEISGCKLVPESGSSAATSASPNTPRDGRRSSWLLGLPQGADIAESDRVSHSKLGKQPAAIVGPIQWFIDGTGIDHGEAHLVSMKG